MGVYEALALLALGAALVAWPMWLLLRVQGLETTIEKLEAENADLRAGLEGAGLAIEVEREIDGARDLAPVDELRVLFPTDVADASGEAAGDAPVRHKRVVG